MHDNGANIRFIQQLLGHEKLETTANYTEVSINQRKLVHAKIHPAEQRGKRSKDCQSAPMTTVMEIEKAIEQLPETDQFFPAFDFALNASAAEPRDSRVFTDSPAMVMDSDLHQLLNQQINNEAASSYAYLAMSAWFEETPYSGFAQWMHVQSLEETGHAMKFYRYLGDRDVKIELQALGKPPAEFSSVVEVFKASLEQERAVTSQIHAIYSKAQDVRDHETTTFLNWFLDEQVEEEKQIRDMIDRLELVGDNPLGLLQLDQEAAQRKPMEVASTADGGTE